MGPQNGNGGGSQTERQDPGHIELWKKAADRRRIEEMTDSEQTRSPLNNQTRIQGIEIAAAGDKDGGLVGQSATNSEQRGSASSARRLDTTSGIVLGCTQ